MEIIRDISEEEMVFLFVKEQMNSFRFAQEMKQIMDKYGADRQVIDSPNLDDQKENELRKNYGSPLKAPMMKVVSSMIFQKMFYGKELCLRKMI